MIFHCKHITHIQSITANLLPHSCPGITGINESLLSLLDGNFYNDFVETFYGFSSTFIYCQTAIILQWSLIKKTDFFFFCASRCCSRLSLEQFLGNYPSICDILQGHQHLSYTVISDCDTVAVHLFLKNFISSIPSKINYFSDGAASQYIPWGGFWNSYWVAFFCYLPWKGG